jgi:hypothetical protein
MDGCWFGVSAALAFFLFIPWLRELRPGDSGGRHLPSGILPGLFYLLKAARLVQDLGRSYAGLGTLLCRTWDALKKLKT